jgi:hypothetical protein
MIMPTIFRYRNVRFVINPHDHPPPHVHIEKPDARAKMTIETQHELEVVGFTTGDIKLFRELVENWREPLMKEWERIHGKSED